MIDLTRLKNYLKYAAILSVASTLGCGSGAKMAPVSGTVTMGGEPVADAIVLFVPRPKEGSINVSATRAMGRTDSDGKYQLSTVNINDGAAVGEHGVTIASSEAMGNPPGVLPPNYLVEVKSGSNTVDLQLEPYSE